MEVHFKLPAAADTELLGAAMASALPRGAGLVVRLNGELGAGKTTCVRALLRKLGVQGTVRSPTYTLVQSYQAGGWTVVHVDLYRLRSQAEIAELALPELLADDALMLIEWPERGEKLPAADLDLTLSYLTEGRVAALRALTPSGARWLSELRLDARLQAYLSNLT